MALEVSMKIECSSYAEFYGAIYALVQHGLGFKARPAKLTIHLSGEC